MTGPSNDTVAPPFGEAEYIVAQAQLLQLAQTIGSIRAGPLEAWIERAHTFGPILDPTGFRLAAERLAALQRFAYLVKVAATAAPDVLRTWFQPIADGRADRDVRASVDSTIRELLVPLLVRTGSASSPAIAGSGEAGAPAPVRPLRPRGPGEAPGTPGTFEAGRPPPPPPTPPLQTRPGG